MADFATQDRQALNALLSSGVVAAARKTLRAEQAEKRRVARSKLSGARDLDDPIANALAKVVAATKVRDQAELALTNARRDYNEAYFVLAGLEQARENIQNSVESALGALADERCQAVDFWLAGMRTLANSAVRTWQEPRMLPMTIRGFFDMQVSQLVDVSNIEEVKQATSALGALRAEVVALVREFEGDDVGPELRRIKASALAALKPLVDARHIRESDIPAIEIAE
ncbi:hypothetical protein [Variovorax sp. dw_308]|uniref:hypothetical protein n=1 Tax=Variovorax sp. dw_308 TaxID=2721546 RepID=UPI001C460D7D|nr:hypothetical protein [Variovorax sp. dw_308]